MDYTCVVFDAAAFGENGGTYKMWYSAYDRGLERMSLGCASSADGVTWKKSSAGMLDGLYSGDNDRPVVLYDQDRFGDVGGPLYKIWYWTGPEQEDSIGAIHYAASEDGINWYGDRAIEQSRLFPLVTGGEAAPLTGEATAGAFNNAAYSELQNWFYRLQGPGYIIYNPNAANTGSKTARNRSDDAPLSYRYVMYYDSASEGFSPDGSMRQISLAYSTDGIFWIRYGDQPVIVPGGAGGWDGMYAYRASVLMIDGLYHMWYAGGDGQAPAYDAKGIGHGTSEDGISWVLDDEPVIDVGDNESWRLDRTGAPCVVAGTAAQLRSSSGISTKMWAMGEDIGGVSAIGYWEAEELLLDCVEVPNKRSELQS